MRKVSKSVFWVVFSLCLNAFPSADVKDFTFQRSSAFIVGSSFVSAKPLDTPTSASSSPSIPEDDSCPTLKKCVESLKSTYEEFNKQLTKDYFSSLEKRIDDSSKIPALPTKNVHIALADALSKVRTQSNLLRQKLSQSDNTQQSSSIFFILDRIDAFTGEMNQKVLFPLSNGGVYNLEALSKVESNLSYSPATLGVYDRQSYNEIKSFFERDNSALANRIQELEKAIDELSSSPSFSFRLPPWWWLIPAGMGVIWYGVALKRKQSSRNQADSDLKAIQSSLRKIEDAQNIIEGKVAAKAEKSEVMPRLAQTVKTSEVLVQQLQAIKIKLQDFSTSNFVVEKYNSSSDFPSHLVVNTVAETTESIGDRRLGQSKTPIMEPERKGEYWVVRDPDNNSRYYIVPSKNVQLNKHSFETLEALYDHDDDLANIPSAELKIKLVSPATVTPNSGETWKLDEKGKLGEPVSSSFVPTAQAAQPDFSSLTQRSQALETRMQQEQLLRHKNEQELRKIQQQHQELQDQLLVMRTHLGKQQLSNDTAQWSQQVQAQLTDLQSQFVFLSDRLEQVTQSLETNRSQPLPLSGTDSHPLEPPSSQPSPAPKTPSGYPLPSWLNDYNNNQVPELVSVYAAVVEETRDSFNHRNGYATYQNTGKGKAGITFEKQPDNGKFWIVKSDQSLGGKKIYYLVPRKNIKFNGYDQQAMPAYFKFEGEMWQSDRHYRVLYPAIVTPCSHQGELLWELVEQGSLELLFSN